MKGKEGGLQANSPVAEALKESLGPLDKLSKLERSSLPFLFLFSFALKLADTVTGFMIVSSVMSPTFFFMNEVSLKASKIHFMFPFFCFVLVGLGLMK